MSDDRTPTAHVNRVHGRTVHRAVRVGGNVLGRGGAAVNVAEFLRQLQARVPGCEAINIRLAGQAEVEISMFIAESVYPFAVSDDEWSDLPALLDELVEWFEENKGNAV